MMVDSQKEATAAALTELGYDVKPMVRVYALTDDSAAAGVLEPDDIIRAADGQPITETDELRAIINDADGSIWARYQVPWQPAYVFYRPDGSSTFVNNPTSAMPESELADRVSALTR